jgi:hypothetical protein
LYLCKGSVSYTLTWLAAPVREWSLLPNDETPERSAESSVRLSVSALSLPKCHAEVSASLSQLLAQIHSPIGGSGSTEFMILAEAGEDEVLYTEDGQYSANLE